MSPHSEPGRLAVLPDAHEYSGQERALLLSLAHRAIEAALSGERLDLTPPTDHLAEFRGVFTTLHLQGELRGCIGYVQAVQPLYSTVAEAAQAAAFQDPRFPPVTTEEAPELRIEVSVLSTLQPIRPEEVVVGKHGLVVMQGSRRGLLLPQVPLEWDWDRETFLSQTCVKAGLPPDAWRRHAELYAFTAEVFGEPA